MKEAFFAFCLLFCVGFLPALAQSSMYEEQLSISGAEDLMKALPADAQELLSEMEISLSQPASLSGLGFETVLQKLSDLFAENSDGPLTALTVMMGIVMVAALFGGLEGGGLTLSLRQSYQQVAVLASGGALLVPLSALLQQAQETVDSVVVFMGSYVPVYAGVLAVSGSVTGAVSYQTILLTVIQLMTWLLRGAVLPLLLLSLGLGCAGAVTEGFPLQGISNGIHKTILWILGLLSTVFAGLLSLQQMVTAAGDTLSGRAVKFSLASFVPVVGGLVSEAYSTVVGCAGLLRSTVGAFGVVATVLVVAPPLVSCICWNLCLQLAATGAGLFRLAPLEVLCKTASGVVKVLIALLAVFALLMIVSTTVVVYAAGR